MKSPLFLLGISSIAVVSSPVQASPVELNQSNTTPNTKNVSSPGIILPALEFTPPTQRINPILPSDNSQDTTTFADVVNLKGEISILRGQIQELMARYRFLTPGIFFLDLQTGEYLDINGAKVFAAASTIKYPILIALFEEVDAGRISLDENLVMERRHLAGGSGNMRLSRVGTRFSLLETATRMMTVSDNTATNMVIDRLGGIEKLNQRFRAWGMTNTVMRNRLGDFQGTNKTSAKDLVRLSALIANNKLLSDASSSQVLNIMYRVVNRSYLPSGLGSGATIAHKTGTLRFILGDAGIIQTSSGRRYLAGILVRRPHHDRRALTFIRQVSQLVYNYLDQAALSNVP